MQDKGTEKLATFLKECLAAGCLKGFEYFELYSRGREELLVTVKCIEKSSVASGLDVSPTKLSTVEGGLPPASPSTKDTEQLSENYAFLIGCYTKYKSPFVWVRSNHSKLVENLKMNTNKDTPLELQTTSQWKNKTTRLWEIVEELVLRTLAPKNPFKVDFKYLNALEGSQRIMMSGALVNFLKKIYLAGPPYADEIWQDIEKMIDTHFITLSTVLPQLRS